MDRKPSVFDFDAFALDDRHLFLRRKPERQAPARRAGDEPRSLLPLEVIDFVHGAIDLIG